ncbi:class I SAM-dependent methyltransferase [Pseudanabaena sp. FACHB-2040]|uniref:class I SAM-dependent methyltransferase n=1 Tax=Pseudanabaena sp. FACHB-2040 TaxID=2692859 RepID=UPI001F54A49C|nr:class I SAM-dependent methyltransferase [Pseudanabaena sp. FACHB-2040]
MKESDKHIAALIDLHRSLDRQGPGDAAFSKHILSLLPELPQKPRIADLGSGTGAGTFVLIEWFKAKVCAVDFSQAFLDELEAHAEARGLRDRVQTVQGDMGSLNWPPASIDLLWSEGAAYNLTFFGALRAWRPLLASNGLAVISEISWFSKDIPEPVWNYWTNAYPAISTEAENSEKAVAAGFRVLAIHRLPASAWWENYYNPLKEKIAFIKADADEAMGSVIQEVEAEMDIFRHYSDTYGYSFYVLQAA